MRDYKSGSHTVWDCKCHLVWTTKYRYQVLGGEVGQRCRKLLREIAMSKEMADHQRFTLATDTKVYFCDLQSPWQRGSNENTNGLLRQYFPKGTDLSVHSQAKLNAVARQLNERPRKTLGLETPA